MKILLGQPFALAAILTAGLLCSTSCQRSGSTTAEKPLNEGKPLNAYWSELNGIPKTLPRREAALPDNYRILRLDLPAMRRHLASTAASPDGQTVEMPLPNGSQQTYILQIPEGAAAERTPVNATYRNFIGASSTDPTATIRFDISIQGLRARMNSGKEVYMIDPYIPGDTVHYISYVRPPRNSAKDQIRRRPVGEPVPYDKSAK